MNGAAVPGDVVEITVLKSQPNSDKALQLLRQVHSKVKPIMKAHGWILPTLAEFFPKNPNLLGINVNRGRKICIRLRPAHDPYTFLPLEEELIGTMLHELTHNHRGPHDEIFNKFLDGLWNEYDSLVSKGYTGEGFLGTGRRVGEGVSHDSGLNPREAREKALKLFEEKERVRKVLGTGGKLGGKAVETKGKRLGDILADAAERRLKARKGCGGGDVEHDHTSGSQQEDLPREVQDEIERAEKDSRTIVIDLTQDEDEDDSIDTFGTAEFVSKGKQRAKREEEEENEKPELVVREESPDLIIVSSSASSSRPPNQRQQPKKKRSISTPASNSNPSASGSTSKRPRRPQEASSSSTTTSSPSEGWTCSLCTYHNPSSLHLSCSVCLSQRPLPPKSKSALPETMTLKSITGTTKEVAMRTSKEDREVDVWVCHKCATEVEKMFWTCTTCGTVKLSS